MGSGFEYVFEICFTGKISRCGAHKTTGLNFK